MSVASHRFNNDLRYRDEDHANQTQLTPPYVLEPVREALGGTIWLDPCTTHENPCLAFAYYAPPLDGAAMTWRAPSIFCNPPYGKARERWVDRCIEAGESGRVVLLIPAHPDTRTFQRAAASADAVVFIKGRVKFGVLRPNRRQIAAASHPSALICWNVNLEPLRHLGVVMAAS